MLALINGGYDTAMMLVEHDMAASSINIVDKVGCVVLWVWPLYDIPSRHTETTYATYVCKRTLDAFRHVPCNPLESPYTETIYAICVLHFGHIIHPHIPIMPYPPTASVRTLSSSPHSLICQLHPVSSLYPPHLLYPYNPHIPYIPYNPKHSYIPYNSYLSPKPPISSLVSPISLIFLCPI